MLLKMLGSVVGRRERGFEAGGLPSETESEASRLFVQICERDMRIRELERLLAEAKAASPRLVDLAEYNVREACDRARGEAWKGGGSRIEVVSGDTLETVLLIVGHVIEPCWEAFEPVADVLAGDGSVLHGCRSRNVSNYHNERVETGSVEAVRKYLEERRGMLVFERPRLAA